MIQRTRKHKVLCPESFPMETPFINVKMLLSENFTMSTIKELSLLDNYPNVIFVLFVYLVQCLPYTNLYHSRILKSDWSECIDYLFLFF